MQVLIGTHSKAKYYSVDDEDAHIPDLNILDRDEAGLVRAICVKAQTSAQRKALFKSIQEESKVKPLQLLLDMTVRWGSTFVMMTRAEPRREVCVRGTPYASDSRPSSASASNSRLSSASAPATSSLFRNAFGRMTLYATRSRPASLPTRLPLMTR